MAQDLAYSYAGIIKQEKQADGTIKVYGKATDDSLDVDLQICDETWLKEAMPQWFKTGGNIREQHSSLAAGVATEYERKADGHYIEALIVDPTSVKKIEAGVLKGFSIGIKHPRVIRDAKATNGRIVGGQIVEISVVDRPANSNAKMTIAKAVDGDLVEVAQEFSERPTPATVAKALNKYSDDQPRDENGRFGSGGGADANGTRSFGDTSAGLDANGLRAWSDDVSSGDGGSGSSDHDRSVAHSQTFKAERKSNAYMEGKAGSAKSQIDKERRDLRDRIAKETDQTKQDALHEAVQHLSEGASRATLAESYRSIKDYDSAARTFAGVKESVDNADRVLRDAFGSKNGLYFSGQISDSVTGYTNAASMAQNAVTERANIKSADIDLAKTGEGNPTDKVNIMSNQHFVNKAVDLVNEIKKFDEAGFNTALASLSDLVAVEAKEFSQGHDERGSIKDLLKSLKHLIHWYRGEVEEGEVANPLLALLGEDADDHLIPETHAAEILMAADGDKKPPFGKDEDEADKDEPAKDDADGAKDDAGSKEPAESEDDDKEDKEEMCAKCNKASGSCECEKSEKTITLDPAETDTIIEKAVKSAREAVEVEIEQLKSAKAEADQRASQLEADLAEALNKSAAGGPVRAGVIKNSKHDADDLLAKAAEYRVKAAGTEDRYLRDGYLELADDLETKARKS